jgi:hypothetical protein
MATTQMQGVVGSGAQATNLPNAQPANVRLGNLGDLIVSELSGPYGEQTYRGNSFSASIQAVATTTVGLATTYTGLVISNPIGSGIVMELSLASVMQSVIQSTQIEAYAIAIGFNATTNVTHTAALTTKSNKVGSGITSLGLADTSATLPTAPTYHTFVQNTGTAIANGTGSVIDLKGSVILMPGAYACWVTPAQASVAGLWFSFSWVEKPL